MSPSRQSLIARRRRLETRAGEVGVALDSTDKNSMPDAVAGALDLKIFETFEVGYDCLCTREKVETALLGLGKDELAKIAREQPETEAKCDFCGRKYTLSADDVRALIGKDGKRPLATVDDASAFTRGLDALFAKIQRNSVE